MKTDTNSRKYLLNTMFHESQREAMGKDNFTTNTERKHFMCTDRRDFTNYQNAVEELEHKRKRSIKRYEQEITDCKQIKRQFELQKQGFIPYGSLITGNQDSIKSSITFRQQNLLKSVRRSLAPRTTHESSTRPVLNYELISKPPSVPHRIKIEIAKREQRRLKETEETVNFVEIKKPESSNIYLDDAVAMYARLRKEVDKEMEKRSHLSLSIKPMTVNQVPNKHNIVNNGALLPTKTILAPTASTATQSLSSTTKSCLQLPPAIQKTDILLKSNGVKTGPMALPKQLSKETSHFKMKKGKRVQDDETSKLERIKKSTERQNTQESQCEDVGAGDDGATRSEGDESELVKANDNNMPPLVNNFCVSPKRQTKSLAFTFPEYNKNSFENESYFKQTDEPPHRRLSDRSCSFVAFERQRSQYNLGEKASTLPLLNKKRRNSVDSPLSLTNSEGDVSADGSEPTSRVGKRFERRSNSIAELSTDKLHAIITEKIISQLTNVQRRSSISSNQQTSLLKNYTRMLQSQLKLDDIPESDSPDFSETPFMRTTTKANKYDSDNEKTETGKVGGSQLWKSHLQFGSFRSSLTYSEIEGEGKVDLRARRRQSLMSRDGAGIVTEKEDTSKLSKLRKKHSRDFAREDDDKNKLSDEV